MVSDKLFEMPPLPYGNEKTLSRHSGVRYAQRVLRLIDHQYEGIRPRKAALGVAVMESERAPECDFKEGVLTTLGAAERALRDMEAHAAQLEGQIEQCAARIEAVQRHMDTLRAAQSRKANEPLHDARFL